MTKTEQAEQIKFARERSENRCCRDRESGERGLIERVYWSRGPQIETLRCKVHWESGRIGYADLAAVEVF